ncbi:MAG: MATE family efflux transporter [Agathobacter sp.]|nr:MATE family efflux transporter [Agathobacter sp.]
MTSGPIAKLLVTFAVPLLLGNMFQMLYNTVDALVVGNFVGKEALAAVGSTASITNIAVLFFNGVSVGGGVVISQFYGAHDHENLHKAIETTMAVTFMIGVLFTILGVLTVPYMLRFMSTPEDVMGEAGVYLRIYFAGIAGLLVYNMASGILRAVGDTAKPLLFLILSSILNILLDLLFVVVLRAGIEGVALATILSQFISAAAVLTLLSRSRDIYRFSWKELTVDRPILSKILSVGLPSGVQAMITAFSNVFVQSYINSFGSGCMAGWSCYNKLDQFVFLPVTSMSQSATTFVSQNIGAGQAKRADRGTRVSILISVGITTCVAAVLFVVARPAVAMFNREPDVVQYGVLFLRMNVFFLIANTVNHVLAGSLRGRGDGKGPMFIMIISFVAIRQTYLFLITRLVQSEAAVGFGYPVGWMSCCVIELTYYWLRWGRKAKEG